MRVYHVRNRGRGIGASRPRIIEVRIEIVKRSTPDEEWSLALLAPRAAVSFAQPRRSYLRTAMLRSTGGRSVIRETHQFSAKSGLGDGSAPEGLSGTQSGVPPSPLALSKTQVSAAQGEERPNPTPKNIVRPIAGSYTPVWATLAGGGEPSGRTL